MSMHFYPYNPDEADVAACGTLLGFGGDVTCNWTLVDCKRCLSGKAKIMAAYEAEETAIVQQMGDMADFMSNKEQPHAPN